MEQLAEKARAMHDSNYGEDFYLEYNRAVAEKSLSAAANFRARKKEIPWPEIGIATAVGATGAGIALHKLGERKELVKASEQLAEELGKIKGKRIDGKKLIEDLQLDIKKSTVDTDKRNSALARLSELGKDNAKIQRRTAYFKRKFESKNDKQKK